MAFITEDQIEKAVIRIFVEKLHYRHFNCMEYDATGRDSENEVVIKPLLRQKLKDLNPQFSPEVIEAALNELCATRLDKSDIHANREIYELLKNGVPLTINNSDNKTEPVKIKVIDYANPQNNDFLIVSQFWIQGDLRLRPDLIVFVNGLPLLFIELKNSNVAVRNAYDDNLTRYRKQIPLLFRYNALCMLSNGIETKIGSFNSGYEYFFNWLRPTHEKEHLDKKQIKEKGESLDYAVLGLCEKQRLLDYIENFIFFYNDSLKIAAKNHQFLGVNNAVQHFAERLQHDKEGTDTANKGKLGVFWHTQGSGKSFSMIFFTRKIARQFTGNYTFLIITDRKDLNKQIYENFLKAGAFGKDLECQPKDKESLRTMLQSNRTYIFTLIQKFGFDKGKAYPLLSTRNDIIIIIDEAHRTQYKDLAENMRTGLPNAQYIAFTGTPLLGSRELTKKWFGDTISEYNFQQSIEDEATVPLFYHKRVPQVLLQNEEIDNDLADIVADEELSAEDQGKLETEFAKEMSILKADDRLETIAKDIVAHFPRRGYLGKGMVISVDKFTAVRMYDKVKRLWEEEKREVQKQINACNDLAQKEELKQLLTWMRKTEMAVVVSEEAGEEEKFKKMGLNITPHRELMKAIDEKEQDIETRFKSPENPLRLVFVCSMWLTGFDAPTVSTLYLDKPMKDHTLMQTIARANRVTDVQINGKPKTNGLIIDYYNVFRNLQKAFASYGGGSENTTDNATANTPAKEIEHLFVLLKDAINQCNAYCKTHNIDLAKILELEETFNKIQLFDEYTNILIEKDEHKKQFIVYDNTIEALYEACKPEIVSRKKEFLLVEVIRYLRQVIDGKVDRSNLDSAKKRISDLLDDSIVSEEEKDEANKNLATENQSYYIKAWKQIDLSKLDIVKLKEAYKKAAYKNIEIADLRAFIENKLKAMIDNNITRKNFADKLQDIIERYNAGASSNENYFDELVEFVENLREEDIRATKEGLTEDELELFDLLKKEKLTKEEEKTVKLAAKNLLLRLKSERPKVLISDWHKDSQTKLQVQATIKKVLDAHLPESYNRTIYATKCEAVFTHFYIMATNGDKRAFA